MEPDPMEFFNEICHTFHELGICVRFSVLGTTGHATSEQETLQIELEIIGTLDDIDKVVQVARSRYFFVNNCSPRPDDTI